MSVNTNLSYYQRNQEMILNRANDNDTKMIKRN